MSTQILDSLCTINPEALGAATPMDIEFRYLDISAVTKGRVDWSATQLWKYADAPSRARRRLRSGDVLLCMVRPGLQAHARIHENEDFPLVGSTGFAVLRPNLDDDSGFVFHQIFSDSVAAQLRALETGSSYPAVNEGDVRRVRVFCPEKEERWRIAAVLDTVDEAIAMTEAVVAKLRQVRAGLLHDLLTRGLDQHGQPRDPIAHPEQFKQTSLGPIPKGWDERTIDQAGEVTKLAGFEFTNFIHYSSSGEIVALRALNIKNEHLDLSDIQRISRSSSDSLPRSKVNAGDILITYIGAYIGDVLLLEQSNRFHLAPNVAKITCKQGVLPHFLQWQLRSPGARRQMAQLITTTATPSLTMTQIRELKVAIPREETEQARIVEAVNSFNRTIECEVSAWNKMKKLRLGLMTDLLTGRVRVPPGHKQLSSAAPT